MPTNNTHTPADITAMQDTEVRALAQSLLAAQMRELATYAAEPRWQQAQWSDSDYDYMGAALDAAQSLLGLAYEGTAADLANWLWATETGLHGPPLAQLAGDGLAPELLAYYDAAANVRDNG